MPTEVLTQLRALRATIAESLRKDPRFLTLSALDKSIAEITGVLSASGLLPPDAAPPLAQHLNEPAGTPLHGAEAEMPALQRKQHGETNGIESLPSILAGEPVIKGTRIAARHVAELVRRGASETEVAEDLDLTPGQIEAARIFDRVTPKLGRPATRKRRVDVSAF